MLYQSRLACEQAVVFGRAKGAARATGEGARGRGKTGDMNTTGNDRLFLSLNFDTVP